MEFGSDRQMKIMHCAPEPNASSSLTNTIFVKHNPWLHFQYRPPRRQRRAFLGMVRISAPAPHKILCRPLRRARVSHAYTLHTTMFTEYDYAGLSPRAPQLECLRARTTPMKNTPFLCASQKSTACRSLAFTLALCCHMLE
jgi:hypothetical protein